MNGWNSSTLETSARSAGVWPVVELKPNLVATFALRSAELSTTDTPTIVRMPRSTPIGAVNQKLSVKPSPSVSVKVREITFRFEPNTNSSVGRPSAFRLKKFGSAATERYTFG